jgi:hypothetical protein
VPAVNDQALRDAVVWLYARDYGFSCPVPRSELDGATAEGEAALRARCHRAIAYRLMTGVDLRLWTSRLARDLFLSEAALARGLGLEDVCDFWIWFDKTMWAEAAASQPPDIWPVPDPGAASVAGRPARSRPIVGGRRPRG